MPKGLPLTPCSRHRVTRGLAGGESDMSVNRIIDGLEETDATGSDAVSLARLGFLEWIFADAGGATPKSARLALADPAAQNPSSPAARAFVGYLRAATHPYPGIAGRRGRARRIH